ncbi:MAG: S8 family serine peptidase, partial [Actinomycetota bacterium]|nr:S8 family serine peptidase [Actinomycetota bacterium]
MRRIVCAAALLALLVPGHGAAARFAVGVEADTPLPELADEIEAATDASVADRDAGLRALFVEAASARALTGLRGIDYVERVDNATRRLAFTPNDPLVGRQWYLNQIRAFDAWAQPPVLPTVLVAVLDSGIDGRHPDLAGRVANARSFVGGLPNEDKRGHGTFVAGQIAATTGNGIGIAGIAFPGQLLIAKIARVDGTVPIEAEARAIRWAVDKGARVINLSIAGVRDPFALNHDTFSRLEASAIAYARRRGALVVAAVGNSDQAPRSPWNFAGYPAALPHVLGVSAVARDGSVPPFSNRDAIYNDVTAPGEDIFSTVPRPGTGARSCPNPGYSDCGPPE